MTQNLWEWAGIVVRDIEGNYLVFQIEDPQGSVTVSQRYERGEDLRFRPAHGKATVHVNLAGEKLDWDQRIPHPRELEDGR